MSKVRVVGRRRTQLLDEFMSWRATARSHNEKVPAVDLLPKKKDLQDMKYKLYF